jgi:hypothetical protein
MVMNEKELDNYLSYLDEDILVMDGFAEAFIGTSQRCGQPRLAVYSMTKMIEVLVDRDGMDVFEAEEYIHYNCIGAWMGELTPVILEDLDV